MTTETPHNGLYTIYYDSNQRQKTTQGYYKYGKKHGKWTHWYENGEKKWEGTYKNGLEIGLWVWFQESGEVLFGEVYEDGEIINNVSKEDVDKLIAEEVEATIDVYINNSGRVILTTENNPQDLLVAERLEIITAECVFGMNIIRDFFADVRNIVGGRSGASQKVLRDARRTCLLELENEAEALGADAVIGVALDYNEFSGGNNAMLFLVASGTAVRLKK